MYIHIFLIAEMSSWSPDLGLISQVEIYEYIFFLVLISTLNIRYKGMTRRSLLFVIDLPIVLGLTISIFISNSESKQLDTASKQNVEGKAPINNVKDLSDKEAIKLSRDDGKEVRGRSSKERVWFISLFSSFCVCVFMSYLLLKILS